MKKLLLSSVIMLGVCGIATAQTDSKLAKQQATNAATPALTPQKAAIMPASDAAVASSDDKEAAAAATRTATQTAKKTQATSVDATGVVVPDDQAAKREAKLAAGKAASAQKPGKHQN